MKTHERAYVKRRNSKTARLPYVAKYFKLGYTLQRIAEKVKDEMGIEKYVKSTVLADIETLKKEWRESQTRDTDQAITLEIERNLNQMREAWEAWEKSKTDYKQKFSKQKGEISGKGPDGQTIKTKDIERGEKDMNAFGDPRYLAEMRMLANQRIELQGLNAPIKKELSGKDGKDLIPARVLTPEEAKEYIEALKNEF